jgi:hypothetical protein
MRQNSPRRSARRTRRLAIGLVFALAAAALRVRAEVIDRVLAVAAGELIMLSDVTAARDLGLIDASRAPDPIAAVLSKLIDRELVLAEVDRYAPPEPSVAAVDRELQQVRARFRSEQAYEAALARSGIDENHLRETLRQNLRIAAYEEQRFTVPPPGDEELARYYREHPQAFTRNGRVEPLENVRDDAVRAFVADRRAALIADWTVGLRRRGDVIDLYLLPAR